MRTNSLTNLFGNMVSSLIYLCILKVYANWLIYAFWRFVMITYADCVRMVLVDTSIPHSIVDIIVKYNEIIYGYLKGIIALFMLVYIF